MRSTTKCRGGALIQRSIIRIRHGVGALADGVLAGITDAAETGAALTPVAHRVMTSQRDHRKSSWVGEFLALRRCKQER